MPRLQNFYTKFPCSKAVTMTALIKFTSEILHAQQHNYADHDSCKVSWICLKHFLATQIWNYDLVKDKNSGINAANR
jgi:hypothetical protein